MIKEMVNLLEKPDYRNLFFLKSPSKKDLEEIENDMYDFGIAQIYKDTLDSKSDDNFEFYEEHSIAELNQ